MIAATTAAESTPSDGFVSFDQNGATFGVDSTWGEMNAGGTHITHFFKRATGVKQIFFCKIFQEQNSPFGFISGPSPDKFFQSPIPREFPEALLRQA